MAFPLRRTVDPATEPISLEAAKLHLRVDIDDDDVLIRGMIAMAREYVEDKTNRCMVSQEWTFAMDRFPVWNYNSTNSPSHPGNGELGNRGWGGMAYMNMGQTIILPRSPLLAVESIQYLDGAQTLQTVDPAKYIVDTLSDPARITPQVGTVWPVAYPQLNAVIIKFTAGYQQTVTETLIASTGTTPTVVLSRASKLLSVTSVTDVASGLAVSVTANNAGTLTLPIGESGLAVRVVYTVTNVPHSLLMAMYLLIAAYYENRSEFVQGEGAMVSIPLGVHALIAGYESQLFGYVGGGY